MKKPRKPWIASRRAALILGYGGMLLGSFALFDAYENRGRGKPFPAKFWPGL